jgi:predicted dehydrogenase
MKNRVGIIGCGKIFPRHIEAINENSEYQLVSICDIDHDILKAQANSIGVTGYCDYKEMIDENDLNFIVIATPNHQHYEQALYCLQNGCDVLIEKPATLDPKSVSKILAVAEKNGQKAYCVLQVRLNSCIQNLKKLIDSHEIGKIRSVSMTQRWQRPKEYFDDWRGEPFKGGGILHECGIHYLDILCYLFGKPNVVASKKYNTKHVSKIEDTVYSIIDYGSFGGTIEVNISSEPSNLECSLSISTDSGFIKLGGKAMNVIERVEFLDENKTKKIKRIMESENIIGAPNSYGAYSGSCPNHPALYKKIKDFSLQETENVLYLIHEIYQECGLIYLQEKL